MKEALSVPQPGIYSHEERMKDIAALRRLAAATPQTSEPSDDISPEEEIIQTAADVAAGRLARQVSHAPS